MIEEISIIIICIFVRLFPARKSATGFDTYGHIYLSQELKKNWEGFWNGVQLNCWNSEKYKLPFLWHFIVSLFPIKLIITHQRWINAIIDSLFAVFIYYTAIKFIGNEKQALVATLIYLFTPMWFTQISMGPRVHTLTPRLFSEITFNLLLIESYKYSQGGDLIHLGIATCLVMVIMMSSKFGMQVIMFLGIPISIILLKFDLFFVIIAGLTGTIIISRGKMIDVILQHFTHLREYYLNSINNKNDIRKRNVFQINKIIKLLNKFEIIKGLKIILFKNSYTAVIFKMPIIFIAIYTIFHDILFKTNIENLYVYYIVIVAGLVFFLINTPNLLFLGEAERYFNHVAFFILITPFANFENIYVEISLYLVIFYGLTYWVIEQIYFNKFTKSESRECADKILENFLKKMNSSQLCISFPYHNFCVYRIMLNTSHSVIYSAHITKKNRIKFVNKYEYRYPYINLELIDELRNESGLTLIIIDKDAMNSEGFELWKPSEEWQEVCREQNIYLVYIHNTQNRFIHLN